MKTLLCIPVFLSFLLLGILADTATAEAPLPKESPVIQTVEKKWTYQEVVEIINQKAVEYAVSADVMTKVIKCESSFKRKAVGDGGNSHGLAQINRPSHPKITVEMAQDPEFAVDFLASNISKGKGDMWTCYRKLKKV